MKKSILSLGAAVALGSLGFAGTAHAIAVFSNDGATANSISLHPSGTGHKLFTPYYTAQGNMASLINVVNTDTANGKAVKVRFRSAANSDDVLDFTLFLSPGDVWSGMVSQNADGRAQIVTPDTSCTIPSQDQWPGVFSDLRLPGGLSEEATNALTREGYVEVLNMADIPPGTGKEGANSALYTAIKHVNGTAPCTPAAFDTLLTPNRTDAAGAIAAGLSNPTGRLMGSWAIFQQDAQGAFSGAQTALIAINTENAGTMTNGLLNTAPAAYAFAPQIDTPIDNQDFVKANTADQLLVTRAVEPRWFDLPDMSTPMFAHTPVVQANLISSVLAKPNVVNEYVATAAGAPVPFTTDWVVSQPTRRYHAVVDYSVSGGKLLETPESTYYSDLTLRNTEYGPQACRSFSLGSYDREEGAKASTGGFSPGTTFPYCGEVFVAQFGAESALKAAITVRNVNSVLAGQAGWASLRTGVTGNGGLPIVGYAAIQFKNVDGGITYDETLPHRWTN